MTLQKQDHFWSAVNPITIQYANVTMTSLPLNARHWGIQWLAFKILIQMNLFNSACTPKTELIYETMFNLTLYVCTVSDSSGINCRNSRRRRKCLRNINTALPFKPRNDFTAKTTARLLADTPSWDLRLDINLLTSKQIIWVLIP